MTKLLLTGLAVMCIASDPNAQADHPRRRPVVSPHGMAATSQPLATQAAIDTLKRGGNAVDAAIAANAVLALTEPTGCGLGGDLFAIVWDAETQKLYGLNASGRSPKSLTRDAFAKRGLKKIPALGPLPVTVPGCVDGWFELHDRFGKLPMADVLAPAIRHAREGFELTPVIAGHWRASVRSLKDYPNFAQTFMPGGRAPRAGETFRNPALADTLEALAAGGRDAFYKGDIARVIAEYMKANGGYLTEEDLAAHRSTWVEPVSTTYRGHTVWELPPNGQGIAALQMLNILEAYDIKSMGFGSAEYTHLLIEAKKLAFEDRAKFYADPEFNRIPVAQLISKGYAAERRKLIDPHRAAQRYPAGDLALEPGDTVYLTTADQDGNMVSLIQSNYRGMGSGMTPPGLGFVLQDRGELFNLAPGHFNTYAPGKRPFHTIIPAFVTRDGRPVMSFGVMGGAMQPQGHVQVLVNHIDFGMDLQAAGDAPRVRHAGSSQPTGGTMTDGGTVYLEPGYPDALVEALEALGHRVRRGTSGFGGYQAIKRDDAAGRYIGASESRKDGHAAGY